LTHRRRGLSAPNKPFEGRSLEKPVSRDALKQSLIDEMSEMDIADRQEHMYSESERLDQYVDFPAQAKTRRTGC